MKSSTYTLSHANRNKLKNDNRFSEHFRQIFASHNIRNDVAEHQDFKIFWESMPPDPPFSSVIKKTQEPIKFDGLLKNYVSLLTSSRNLDYVFYSAFDSSKGKNRLDN